jgi:hypothetical protein
MSKRIVAATAAFAIPLALGLSLAPTVATPALAASNPALFSFTAGFGDLPFLESRVTVSGTADPASGDVQITRDDGYEGCSADVDPESGAFSCDVYLYQSTPSLNISAQHQNTEEAPATLGSANVSVLLPPWVNGVSGERWAAALYTDAPYAHITGGGIPSTAGSTTTEGSTRTDGSTTTVRAVVPTDDGDVSCTVVTDAEGLFDCELPSALLAGDYALAVTQEPSWAEGTISLQTEGGVALTVYGPEFVLDGENAYTLDQGDSLDLTGGINFEGSDINSSTVITATMSIAGTNVTPFECGPLSETYGWECSLATAPTRAGTYTVELAATNDGEMVRLAANSDGGLIARDRSTSVTVIGAPTATPAAPAPTPSSPTPTPTPEAPLEMTVVVDGFDGSPSPGDPFLISSANLPPKTTIDAEIRSTPISLGSTVVGADGTFSLTTAVPLEIEPGAHTIVVTATAPGREPVISRTPVTVAAAPELAETFATDATSSAPVDEGAISAASARNEPGAVNGMSESIRPFWETLASPVAIGSAILAGSVFLVFAAFPAELLKVALADRYQLMQRRGRVSLPRWLAQATAWFSTRPVVGGVTLLATASLIIGFADPAFGFDLASLRLLIAFFITGLVLSYGVHLITSMILNRRWSLPASISFRPHTLIITVIGVVLSRLLDFSPGFLFGLMLGLSFPVGTAAALRARARVLRTGIILGIALIAWVAYSFVNAGLTNAEPSFATALLRDSLAALSTAGLVGMLIAMLPFLLMDGHELWSHSKRVWAGSYAAVIVVFFLVVAPKPESWGDLGPKYGSWMLVLGCFTAVSLTAYFWSRWDTRRRELRGRALEDDHELQNQ